MHTKQEGGQEPRPLASRACLPSFPLPSLSSFFHGAFKLRNLKMEEMSHKWK